MRKSALLQGVIVLSAVLALASPAFSAQKASGGGKSRAAVRAFAQTTFDTLKSLEGDWQGKAYGDDKPPVILRYKVTQQGTVVMETFAPGTKAEMITMYHMNDDKLVLTHYCAAGNQPNMTMSPARSKAGNISFAYAGASNLLPSTDTYMHNGSIHVIDADHLETNWTTYKAGKLLDSQKVAFERVKQ